MAHRRSVIGLVAFVSAWASAPVFAEDLYVGTVTSAGAKPVSVTLTLAIREYTSDERVLELAQLLHGKGQPAVVAEMAKQEAGSLRLGDLTFRANVIRLEKTDKGRIVRVLTDRPIQLAAGAAAVAVPGNSIGYLELKLGAGGEGDGRLLPAAKVVFDAEGFLAPESLGETWPVSKIKWSVSKVQPAQ